MLGGFGQDPVWHRFGFVAAPLGETDAGFQTVEGDGLGIVQSADRTDRVMHQSEPTGQRFELARAAACSFLGSSNCRMPHRFTNCFNRALRFGGQLHENRSRVTVFVGLRLQLEERFEGLPRGFFGGSRR